MQSLLLVKDSNVLTTGDNDQLLDKLLHAISHATEINIAVSFIQPSGLELLIPALQEAIEKQDKLYPLTLRILTSDYLHITHPSALRELLSLQGDNASIKIFQSANKSFHMKNYIFVRTDKNQSFYEGSAFVGSNNISKSALTDAYEWCLRYDYKPPADSKEAKQFNRIMQKFNEIFNHEATIILSDEWIVNYIKIRQVPTIKTTNKNVLFEEDIIAPNNVQQQALAALADTRQEGFISGLVVLATGMGKTYLAAFDAKQMNAKRILFVAHRSEILKQALNTFAKVLPEKSSGFYKGDIQEKNKDMIFASVQTLGKEKHYQQFAIDHFDYIVVDEFHHASAKTYKNIINYFQPQFLLGLTATPERTDQADILSLCSNNLVFERNLVDGINDKILVTFSYFGIWDEFVDYAEIPWRNGKFDPNALEAQFATKQRAKHVFDNWIKHKQSRTLAFCISIKHAEFMAEEFNQKFNQQGFKALAVHSNSAIHRFEALHLLDKSEIQVIFSVDLFNEGVDLPRIDTILMLRPTESKILFLQQLGRGLRIANNKLHLIVIDFIGNHKSFLNKTDVLGTSYIEAEKNTTDKDPHLADGCFVNIDPRIIEFWQQLIKKIKHTAEGNYLKLKNNLGHRPTLTEFYRAGYDIQQVNKQHESWFNLVAKQDDINLEAKNVVTTHHDFLLHAVQATAITKSFKMILLEAFLELNGLRNPPTLEDLAEKSWQVLQRYPFLKETELAKNVKNCKATDKLWLTYWKKNPIHYSIASDKKTGINWFVVDNKHFKANFAIAEHQIDILHDLVQELVDYRLAEYVFKKQKENKNNTSANDEKLLHESEKHNTNLVKLPYYPNIKIACGHFKTGRADECEMMAVDIYNANPKKHFLARASGDSMNGGKNAIKDGDLLLLELMNPNSAGSITGKTLVIENQDETGNDQYLLRVVEKHQGKYYLKANNPDYKTIPATENFRTFARFKQIVKK